MERKIPTNKSVSLLPFFFAGFCILGFGFWVFMDEGICITGICIMAWTRTTFRFHFIRHIFLDNCSLHFEYEP
jgi:hypothetical protein